VRKTGRCLVVHEDGWTAGFGAEILATLGEAAFFELDAPLRRVAVRDLPEMPGAASREVGVLHALPELPDCPDSPDEVRIAGNQNRHIVRVGERQHEHINDDGDVDALLHVRTERPSAARLQLCEHDPQMWNSAELHQKPLLLRSARIRVRKGGIVVVGTHEASRSHQFPDELPEVKVVPPHGILAALVEVTPINEDGHPG